MKYEVFTNKKNINIVGKIIISIIALCVSLNVSGQSDKKTIRLGGGSKKALTTENTKAQKYIKKSTGIYLVAPDQGQIEEVVLTFEERYLSIAGITHFSGDKEMRISSYTVIYTDKLGKEQMQRIRNNNIPQKTKNALAKNKSLHFKDIMVKDPNGADKLVGEIKVTKS